MSIATVRRIASRLLKVGERRVRFDPERINDVSGALTADDVRGLIEDGAVIALQEKGVPRVRARMHRMRRKKGRGGVGSRKGSKYGRVSKKEMWMSRVRAQRGLLSELREKKQLKEGVYRQTYRMVKGGAFKSRASMLAHLRSAKMLKELKVKERNGGNG